MHTESIEAAPVQDLFSDEDLSHHQEAVTGKRFLNYLIDALLMQYVLSFGTTYVMVSLFSALSEDGRTSFFHSDSGINLLFSAYLISIVNYLVYYTFCEKVFRGYTLGKLINRNKSHTGRW